VAVERLLPCLKCSTSRSTCLREHYLKIQFAIPVERTEGLDNRGPRRITNKSFQSASAPTSRKHSNSTATCSKRIVLEILQAGPAPFIIHFPGAAWSSSTPKSPGNGRHRVQFFGPGKSNCDMGVVDASGRGQFSESANWACRAENAIRHGADLVLGGWAWSNIEKLNPGETPKQIRINREIA